MFVSTIISFSILSLTPFQSGRKKFFFHVKLELTLVMKSEWYWCSILHFIFKVFELENFTLFIV